MQYEIETETDRENLIILIRNAPLGSRVDVKKRAKGKRTVQQNRAMRVYWKLLAEALNDAGFDMKVVLNDGVEIPWNEKSVEDQLWRPVMKAVTNEASTANADTSQYDEIHKYLSKKISEKTGVYVPWPSLRG